MTANLESQILLPNLRPARNPYVDFVLALDYLSINSQLLSLMQQSLARFGLSCLLINQSNVEDAIRQAKNGSLKPIVFLDLCSRPGDRFEALLHAMKAGGARAICSPDHLPWTYKAQAHPQLLAAGLPLPNSVLIKKTEADRDLTAAEREFVGERCVIKPSFGVAGLGVVVNVEPTKTNIKRARDYNRDDDWLIQQLVPWTNVDGHQAYLRAYNVLGQQTLMWWNNQTGYSQLTWEEFRRHDLLGAVEITRKITALTGMEYFSSEIAITDGPERFVLIDYINDQCDIDPQAQPDRSPPASWVEWVCQCFARYTHRVKHELPTDDAGTLYLPA